MIRVRIQRHMHHLVYPDGGLHVRSHTGMSEAGRQGGCTPPQILAPPSLSSVKTLLFHNILVGFDCCLFPQYDRVISEIHFLTWKRDEFMNKCLK